MEFNNTTPDFDIRTEIDHTPESIEITPDWLEHASMNAQTQVWARLNHEFLPFQLYTGTKPPHKIVFHYRIGQPIVYCTVDSEVFYRFKAWLLANTAFTPNAGDAFYVYRTHRFTAIYIDEQHVGDLLRWDFRIDLMFDWDYRKLFFSINKRGMYSFPSYVLRDSNNNLIVCDPEDFEKKYSVSPLPEDSQK